MSPMTQQLFFKDLLFLIKSMYMGMYTWLQIGATEARGIWPTRSCEIWVLIDLWALEEQQMLWPTLPSLQPLEWTF